ncbi:MAG TPA: hypothetical protein VNN22_19390 [Verrucomicrobiae bacterium]|nr:hypothetical protein [Verrucomicrobiae bacterium]
MNIKRKSIWLITVALFLIFIWFLRKPSLAPSDKEQEIVAQPNEQASIQNSGHQIESNTPSTDVPLTREEQDNRARIEQTKREMSNWTRLWRTPLLYYGKVVDESDQPIPGVQISYNGGSANESLTEETRNEGSVTTDERGIFKIDGLYGIGLMFELSHSNYYPYPDNSTGFNVRSRPRDGVVEDSEAHARIFRMHSKGHPVPLLFRSGGFHAPHDGSTTNYPLRGNTRAEILGQLQIQGWSGLRSDTNSYDWKVQLNLPNGGIIETTNNFDFIAPETGYAGSVNFEVGGSESTRKIFFLRLPTGYVRFKLLVIMGKDMFVTADYYFNPDGSRNLEPNQVIYPAQ